MAENTPDQIKSPNKAAALGTLAALTVAGCALLLGSLAWYQSQQQTQLYKQQLQQLNENLTQLSQQVTADKQQLSTEQSKIHSFINSQTNNNLSWQLNEAAYLIHLANFSVSFEHNVQAAITLLQTANTRIAELDNPNFVDLRQALTNDITALQAVPQADLANILLQLNALGEQIAKLPIIATPNAVQQQPVTTHHHHQPGWKRGLEQSWEQLKQIIVVQYHDKPVGQLLIPQNRNYLDLHLQMLLAEAQWSSMHQQKSLYDESLQQASNWVKNTYVESAPQTLAMLKILAELQQQNIAPELPDISDSLKLINKHIAESNAMDGGTPS